MSRQGQSDHLDSLIDIEYERAAAAVKSEGLKKTASTKEKEKEVIKDEDGTSHIAKMSFLDARIARRSGKFIKIAGRNDLYQDVETNDLWKVSETKDSMERTFDENEGIVQTD